MTHTIILDVPYKEKYIASTAGAKWHKDTKRWTFTGESLPVVLLPFFNIKLQNEQYLMFISHVVSSIPDTDQNNTLHTKTKNNKAIKPNKNNKYDMADKNITSYKSPASEYLSDEKAKGDIYTTTKKDITNLALLLASKFTGRDSLYSKPNPASKTIKIKMAASFIAKDVIIKNLKTVIVKNVDIYKAITFVIERNLNCTFNSPLPTEHNDEINHEKITSGIWLKSKNITSTKGILDILSLSTLTIEAQTLLFDTPVSDVINELESKAIAVAHEQFSFLNEIKITNIDVRKFIVNDFSVEIKGRKLSLPYHRKIIDVNGESFIRVGNNKFIKLFEIPSVVLFSKKLKELINLWHANILVNIKEGTLNSIDLLGNLWTAKIDNGSIVSGTANRGDWLITSIDNLRIDSYSIPCKKSAQIIKNHHISS
jgi:hypothetical protein